MQSPLWPISMNTHEPSSDRISHDHAQDDKQFTEHLDEIDNDQNHGKRDNVLEAPPMVRDLSLEERQRLEKNLVRKIDFRLLPAVIIMYIMNYLDRVSIARHLRSFTF